MIQAQSTAETKMCWYTVQLLCHFFLYRQSAVWPVNWRCWWMLNKQFSWTQCRFRTSIIVGTLPVGIQSV